VTHPSPSLTAMLAVPAPIASLAMAMSQARRATDPLCNQDDW
jgi:hypothetical protein